MLHRRPNKGERVRFIGDVARYGAITLNKEYEVASNGDEYAVIYDDAGKRRFLGVGNDKYELVTESAEAPHPDVYALLANLALRLHEVEAENKQQAYEINELYRTVAELEAQK